MGKLLWILWFTGFPPGEFAAWRFLSAVSAELWGAGDSSLSRPAPLPRALARPLPFIVSPVATVGIYL